MVQAAGFHHGKDRESDQETKHGSNWCRGTQPERDENGEGRKRAEKGQKMAERTKGVRHFLFNIRMLGWLGNLDSNQD